MKISDITEIIKTFGAIATTALSIYLTYRLGKMHKQFNSKMDQALITKEQLGTEIGKAIGKKENQAETDAKPQEDK